MTGRQHELATQLYSATPKNADRFPTTTVEVWLAKRLNYRELFEGVTTAEIRRERVRERIVSTGMADAPAGNRDGQPETFASLFERLYGEPL